MHQINSTHLKKKKNGRSDFFHFFGNFERDFGTLGIGIAKIGLQVWTSRPRIRLYANFGKFDCIISIKKTNWHVCSLSPCT